MNIIQNLKQNKLLSYFIVSGAYGFARSLNGSYDYPYDLIGNKLLLASFNSIYYSLYAPYYQLKLINRIEIKLRGKDISKYKDCYEDMFSTNYNVFL